MGILAYTKGSRIEEKILASVLSVRLLPLLVQAQSSDLSFTGHRDLTPTLHSQLGDSYPAYRTDLEEIWHKVICQGTLDTWPAKYMTRIIYVTPVIFVTSVKYKARLKYVVHMKIVTFGKYTPCVKALHTAQHCRDVFCPCYFYPIDLWEVPKIGKMSPFITVWRKGWMRSNNIKYCGQFLYQNIQFESKHQTEKLAPWY